MSIDGKFKHGRNGYVAHGCRSEICSLAASMYSRRYNAERQKNKVWLSPNFVHGANGYSVGCRCETCKMSYSCRRKTFRAEHLDLVRGRERERTRLHAAEHRKRVIEYNKSHPEKTAIRVRRYKVKNRDKIRIKNREYRHAHAEEFRQKQRIYQYHRYHTDVSYHILKNLRSRISRAIKRGSKSANTMTLLGCSIPELIKHIEHQFQSGMSWKNQGQWHIDHIRPCSSFDFSNPEHQKICFNWKNLQPLWAKDNWSKNAKCA